MPGSAGFNADKARRLLLKERQDLARPIADAPPLGRRIKPIVVTSFMAPLWFSHDSEDRIEVSFLANTSPWGDRWLLPEHTVRI
jgi:hypothetical protein